MRQAKPKKQRLKLILSAIGMTILGVLLIFLCVKIRPESVYVSQPTATAPASAPESGETPPHRPPPIDPKAAMNRNMSSMLLLFGLMSFTVAGVCVVLVVLDIRRSRPAWQTQTRYPRRR